MINHHWLFEKTTEPKRIFVLHSGGLDSTYMVTKLIAAGHFVTTGYVVIENNYTKVERERKAISHLTTLFYKYAEEHRPKNVFHTECDLLTYRVKGEWNKALGYKQLPGFLLGLLASVDTQRFDIVAMGYALGDQMISHISDIESIWSAFEGVCVSPLPKLEFPLKTFAKAHMVDNLPDEVLARITWCESEGQYDFCGVCGACERAKADRVYIPIRRLRDEVADEPEVASAENVKLEAATKSEIDDRKESEVTTARDEESEIWSVLEPDLDEDPRPVDSEDRTLLDDQDDVIVREESPPVVEGDIIIEERTGFEKWCTNVLERRLPEPSDIAASKSRIRLQDVRSVRQHITETLSSRCYTKTTDELVGHFFGILQSEDFVVDAPVIVQADDFYYTYKSLNAFIGSLLQGDKEVLHIKLTESGYSCLHFDFDTKEKLFEFLEATTIDRDSVFVKLSSRYGWGSSYRNLNEFLAAHSVEKGKEFPIASITSESEGQVNHESR